VTVTTCGAIQFTDVKVNEAGLTGAFRRLVAAERDDDVGARAWVQGERERGFTARLGRDQAARRHEQKACVSSSTLRTWGSMGSMPW